MPIEPKTILLIEDNPADIELTVRAFQKNKISNHVVILRDGSEALNYLFARETYEGRNVNEVPQVILLDLQIPKIPGLEVLKQIRQDARTRRIPVVILSSSSEKKDIQAGYNLGANSYIRKPIDFNEFAETAKNLGEYWLYLNETPSQKAISVEIQIPLS